MDVERVKIPTLVFECPFGTWLLLYLHVCEKSFGSAVLAAFPGVDVWLGEHNKQLGR